MQTNNPLRTGRIAVATTGRVDPRAAAGGADRVVVIDTETTGIYSSDRLVEMALVTVSLDGQVLDVWDTLVQPGRDVGPTHIRGITASMIRDAPVFEEVRATLPCGSRGRASPPTTSHLTSG